jgi:hypothetical protein
MRENGEFRGHEITLYDLATGQVTFFNWLINLRLLIVYLNVLACMPYLSDRRIQKMIDDDSCILSL